MARRGESCWVRTFEVTSPSRHKKGFTVYKVTSKVYLKSFPEGVTSLTVWKRYNDFKKLYKELQTIHRDLHLGGEFPKFSKPKAFGFGRFDHDIVEERQKSALALLEFAARHCQLFTNKVFVQFFENGYQVKESLGPEEDETDSMGKGDSAVRGRIPKDGNNGEHFLSPGDEDGLSVSSVGSSTAETATLTDSDSMISSGVFSTDTPSLMQPSNTVDFGSLSFLSSVGATSLAESGDSRSELTPSEKTSTHGSKARPGNRDSAAGESYVEPPSNLSLVSTSKSCPSLDDISSISNGPSTSQPEEEAKVKRRIFKPSWSLSIRRKPNGISGFFDFLPIFPKMTSEKKVLDEKLLSDSLASSYICEAAGHFSVAQQNESNGDLQDALESYKEGIRILLSGGQNDKDTKRRLIVRNKVEKYLSKAEQLHSSLSTEGAPSSVLFSPKKVQSILNPGNSSEASKLGEEIMKPSCVEELKNYKVVGIAAPGILIVVNTGEKTGLKCFCIKVLRKSSIPLDPNRETLIANKVPFMVKLIKWFESENTIILLMQYAGGGRLEDFVSTYQSKSIAIIPHDFSPCQDEDNDTIVAQVVGSSDEESLKEDEENSTSVLPPPPPPPAEQLENNSFDLNGNLAGKEELCESYARLFQESDTEDSSCPGQVKGRRSKGKDGSTVKGRRLESHDEGRRKGKKGQERGGRSRKDNRRNCETSENIEVITTCTSSTAAATTTTATAASSTIPHEKVEKLTVDSPPETVDVNEALESDSKVRTTCITPTISTPNTTSTTATTNTTAGSTGNMKVNGLRKQVSDMMMKGSAPTTMSLLSDSNPMISWTNLDAVDTGDLIESSKVLLQTVSRTLNQCEILPGNSMNLSTLNNNNKSTGNSKDSLLVSVADTQASGPTASATSASGDKWEENCGKFPEVSSSSREHLDCSNTSLGSSASAAGSSIPTTTATRTKLLLPAYSMDETSSGGIGVLSEQSSLPQSSASSLSLSGRKQKGGTNETENNNSKKTSSRSELDLMSSEIAKQTSATHELLEKISEETKLPSDGSTRTPLHCCHPSPNHSEFNEDLSPCSEPLPIQRMVPECCVKVWIAEMVLALEKLHALGLTYGDLGMRNILLGENGHILLSFTSQWAEVDHIPKRSDWIAPEARHCLENSEEKIHFSADWWSLGAILFYLLTGKSVQSCHPEGFHTNTALRILDKNLMEEDISQHAKSLMTELLQINPTLRLGYYGAEEIKSHPFFDGFDWDGALNDFINSTSGC